MVDKIKVLNVLEAIIEFYKINDLYEEPSFAIFDLECVNEENFVTYMNTDLSKDSFLRCYDGQLVKPKVLARLNNEELVYLSRSVFYRGNEICFRLPDYEEILIDSSTKAMESKKYVEEILRMGEKCFE